MGFFSWKTSDTKKSIANTYSNRSTFPVYMVAPDGRHWKEDDYEGYGVFGGKDIYELIAELNGKSGRNEGIGLTFLTVLKKGNIEYVANRDFWGWDHPLHQGMTPNQMVTEGGFEKVHPYGYGDWNKAAEVGIILPKLFERESSVKMFDEFEYPKDCEYQGFFY